MEHTKTIVVDIPCNDIKVIHSLIERYSKLYKIDISVVGEEDRGGVNFISISSESFTPNLIFEIGYYYSGYIRQLRDKNEIDW